MKYTWAELEGMDTAKWILLVIGILMILVTMSSALADDTHATIVRPNGDGSPLQWYCLFTPCSHYQQVDESFPDEDSTYVYSSTDEENDEYTLQNMMSGENPPDNEYISIDHVVVNCRARETISTRPAASISCKLQYPSPMAYVKQTLWTGYSTYTWTQSVIGTLFDNRPFTIADIDGAEITAVSDDIISKNIIRLTQAYLLVNWSYIPEINLSWVSPTPPTNNISCNDWAYLNLTSSSGYQTAITLDFNHDLLGWWMFDYYNNSGVFDNSTYDNFIYYQELDGFYYTNSSNITDAKYGKGFELSEDASVLNTPCSAYKFLNSSFTVESWFKKANESAGRIFSTKFGGGTRYFILMINDTASVQIEKPTVPRTTVLNGTTSISLDEWHHVAVTKDDDGTAKLYVDGNLEDSDYLDFNFTGVRSSTTCEVGGEVLIGAYPVALDPFIGILDEVKTYNRSLSWQEINASIGTYDDGLAVNFTNLPAGFYEYYACAINTVANESCTETRNITITTCCTGTEDCVVDCSKNPIFYENQDLNGYTLTLGGNGTATLMHDVDITNWEWLLIENVCKTDALLGDNILRGI